VRELDDDEVARLQRCDDFLPPAFIEETFRAAAVDRVILHDRRIDEKLPQRHAPAAFR
jgi:hypothetical protein